MSNGYVIYPDSIGMMDLRAARKYAIERSQEKPYYARIMSCDDESTIALYEYGEEA